VPRQRIGGAIPSIQTTYSVYSFSFLTHPVPPSSLIQHLAFVTHIFVRFPSLTIPTWLTDKYGLIFTFQVLTSAAVLRSQKLLTNTTLPLLLIEPICSHFHYCKSRRTCDSLASGLRQRQIYVRTLLFLVVLEYYSFIHSLTHSVGMCRMRQFFAVLRSFFHSSLLCTLSLHSFPPTSLPSPSLHPAISFLVYLSALLFPNSYIIIFGEIYFLPFSVHARTNVNLFNLIFSVIVNFSNHSINVFIGLYTFIG
jgi:hypothetical protein